MRTQQSTAPPNCSVFTFIGIIQKIYSGGGVARADRSGNCCIEMGNSPSGSGPRLLENGKCFSYHIKLDNAATITVTKDQENSELEYDVDGMTCTVSISRTRNSDVECLCMNVKDCYEKIKQYSALPPPPATILAKVSKKQSDLVCHTFSTNRRILVCINKPAGKSGRSSGAGVETSFWAYGHGSRMGLFVVVEKKKSNEERSNMVTAAHYYVNSVSGGNFGGRGGDIGFSVVVKIGVISGQLDFSVDGPVEHPSSALLYMIEEVTRTGTWTLSSCPHCKNIQSQRRWLSESEDSDTSLPPGHYGGPQNATNMGQFNGDGNGSIIQASKVNFNKW